MKYDFTKLVELVSDLGQQLKLLQAQSQGLEDSMKNTAAAFSSPEASAAYQVAQSNFNDKFLNAQLSFNKTINNVEAAGSGMKGLDGRIATTLGG